MNEVHRLFVEYPNTREDLPECVRALARLTLIGIRPQVLCEIAAKPTSVKEIAENIGVDASAVSHVLRELRRAGIVESTSFGRQRRYSLSEQVHILITGPHISVSIRDRSGIELKLFVNASSLLPHP